MRWTGWTSCSRTRRSDAGVKRAIASASPSSAARLRVHKSPGQVRCLPGLECCAPRGNRTPNPLILVAGFATTLNNTSTAALSSMYSSRSMKLACRPFALLLVQRRGLKCGSRRLG
jgi:hypothetical protein